MKKLLIFFSILFIGLPSISNASPLSFTIDTDFGDLTTGNFATILVNELKGDLEINIALNIDQLGSNADLLEFCKKALK